ncbi:MAG: hypothetical protein IK092_01985 [Muribaculaceae bacterium]|nr:hypothetical protein [Muribaculaceae bacterium]
MKRFVITLLIAIVALGATADNKERKSTIHFKSGEWVEGVITSRNNLTVEIVNAADGIKYVYNTDEIDYISHEAKKKNYDTAKFRGFIDLGYSLGVGEPRNDFWLVETSFGYQFTPNYYLGAGIGVHNFDAKIDTYPMRYDLAVPEHNDPNWRYPFIPVYLEGRYNFRSETYNTPFVSLKVGTTFINHPGFYTSPTVGYHFKSNQYFSFNVGIAYALHTAKYKLWCTGDTKGAIPDDSGKCYLNQHDAFHNFMLKVGVEF